MSASINAADETVSFFLSRGASPDKTDANGNTALIYAIHSKCVTTMSLLAPVTRINLRGALIQLSKYNGELTTEELIHLVERAAQDRDTAIGGLLAAAMFGSSKMITLINNFGSNHSISKMDELGQSLQ